MAYYDGANIFGVAVVATPVRNADASQVNAFFGASGTQTLFGGSRGWTIMVTGSFVGSSWEDVIAVEGIFLSYADGIARTFVDNMGRTFPQVVFNGDYQPAPEGVRPATVGGVPGYALRYRAVFRSLS